MQKIQNDSNQKIKHEIKKDKIKEEVEGLKNEKEEWRNKYLRALADYQNFEKRTFDEKTRIEKRANGNLIIKLLPFLDSLEKAEVFIKDQGLKMIREKFYQVLKENKVEEIQILGHEFDPFLAEAVDIVEGDKDNIVVEVTRKGYKYNDMILRIAQVKVSKKKINNIKN